MARGFELITRGFELLTSGFGLVTRGFEFQLVLGNLKRAFKLSTRNS